MTRAAAFLLLFGAVPLAAAPPPEAIESAADAVAAEVLAAGPHAGLTIAVSRGGKAVFAKGYGEADLRRHVAATADTVYPICSISKNFAAAAVVRLAEEGRLDLDAPVTRYFAKDPLPGRRVSVRRLLNHTSGAGSYDEGPEWDAVAGKAQSRDAMLARIVAAQHGEPGKKWGYSNSAFYLAGMIVEKVTGKGYWDYLETAFIRPLGMRRTRACTAVPRAGRASGYGMGTAGLEDAETES